METITAKNAKRLLRGLSIVDVKIISESKNDDQIEAITLYFSNGKKFHIEIFDKIELALEDVNAITIQPHGLKVQVAKLGGNTKNG